MATIVDDNVMVCTDCMMYIANGDNATRNGWAIKRNWKGYHLFLDDSGKDDEFSSRPCEGCGARFTGARFHCVALED
jgi:hypothetical protein